jgi:hypothetical protein
MAASFHQLLGTVQAKASGTSLVIAPSSKTLTVGRSVFVAVSSDTGTTISSVVDNLGNTYTQQSSNTAAGAITTWLYMAPVTTGGSVTSITVTFGTAIVARTAVAGEFSNFGTFRLAGGSGNLGASVCTGLGSNTFFNGELWIAALGAEDDVKPTAGGSTTGVPTQTQLDAGSINTAGGGSASNIAVVLTYILISADSSTNATLTGLNSGTQNCAGAGAIYNVYGVFTNAAAVTATGTGAVFDPSELIAPDAELATGTGAVLANTIFKGRNVDAAFLAGTGQAFTIAASIKPDAELAAGTGLVQNEATTIAPGSGLAIGTGTAADAAATGVTGGNPTQVLILVGGL